MNKIVTVFIGFLYLVGCSFEASNSTQNQPSINLFPNKLPVPVSNNAVAYLSIDNEEQYFSFNGLLSGKTYLDITQQAFVWQHGKWSELEVPATQLPVLASTAVAVGTSVYLIGGYTVAADHSEKSIPNIWQIDAATHQWSAMPAMPTPVDDTVALVYQDRYIYLISGWHDVDNVNLVQVFDTKELTWQQATVFPLPAVFGHAGGIVDNKMLICDGVKVLKVEGKKQFMSSPACVVGLINPENVTEIIWQSIEHHSDVAYYRMAAASNLNQVYFMGGSDNPYNYNGIGYNEIASEPSSDVRIFDFLNNSWTVNKNALPATMDHRAALATPHGFVIMGGMRSNQQVSDQVIRYQKFDKNNTLE